MFGRCYTFCMINFTNKARTKKAKDALQRARELAKTTPSKFDKMTKAQVLSELRKTREKLFNEKLKTGYRY